MTGAANPPFIARRLLELALPEDERAPVSGDLLEVFRRERAMRGRTRAGLWYWCQTLAFSGRFMAERVMERLAGDVSLEEWSNPAWAGGGNARNIRWSVSRMLDGWGRDLSHAVRSLSRAPGFTAVVVATLALAIGANAAILVSLADWRLARITKP